MLFGSHMPSWNRTNTVSGFLASWVSFGALETNELEFETTPKLFMDLKLGISPVFPSKASGCFADFMLPPPCGSASLLGWDFWWGQEQCHGHSLWLPPPVSLTHTRYFSIVNFKGQKLSLY